MARKEGKARPDKPGKEDEEETRTNTSQSAAAAARISWFVILQIAANCLNFPTGWEAEVVGETVFTNKQIMLREVSWKTSSGLLIELDEVRNGSKLFCSFEN